MLETETGHAYWGIICGIPAWNVELYLKSGYNRTVTQTAAPVIDIDWTILDFFHLLPLVEALRQQTLAAPNPSGSEYSALINLDLDYA